MSWAKENFELTSTFYVASWLYIDLVERRNGSSDGVECLASAFVISII